MHFLDMYMLLSICHIHFLQLPHYLLLHFLHLYLIFLYFYHSSNLIYQILKEQNIKVKNLCNKTTIKTLCQNIAFCDLFITNDSGPMHISAVYKVKTVAIFGPTKFTQTSPWQNENAKLVHLDLTCMPCMQKTCPLKHHKCMKDLKPQRVIEEARNLLKNSHL